MLKLLFMLLIVAGAGGALYYYRAALLWEVNQIAPLQGSPTRLHDRRVPGFTLPGLVGPGFEARNLLGARKPMVIKFWGSWSPAVIQEYPLLLELQASRVEMWAIAFRDSRTKALDYLERNGNPYARVAFDAAGRVASDWGVDGVPSTFVVDGDGIVRWYFAGPLTPQVVEKQLRPMLERYTP